MKNVFKPELKANFITDTFTDFNGVERHFTVAAVSVPRNMLATIYTGNAFKQPNAEKVDGIFEEDTEYLTFEKVLFIGVAVQRAEDSFDEELGKKIAYGKALKYQDRYLFVSHKGLVNTTMVEALIKQEAEYFKKDPGFYIKGYDEAYHKSLKKDILPAPSAQRSTVDVENTGRESKIKDDLLTEVQGKKAPWRRKLGSISSTADY